MSSLETSQIFFNWAVGIASGAFVIAKAIANGFRFIKNRSIETDFKKKYPRDDLGKTFRLVDTEEAPGKIYLLDTKSKKRHWISSASTMRDLNYHWTDVERIPKSDFDKYKEGAGILTSGIQGT